MNFNAIIIEDEIPARITLKSYLNKYFPNVKVIQEIDNLKDALSFFKENKETGIVFIDIQLKDGKTTDILNFIDSSRYKTVFTTAHENYTQIAFKHKSFGYLLKPLDPDDFKEILDRVLRELRYSESKKKIKIPVPLGYKWVSIEDIIRCEAESNYTRVYLKNIDQFFTISKTLKYVEEELINSSFFFRIHQSHLINVNYIKNAEIKKDQLTLKNGETVPVSRAHKNELYELLNKRLIE